MIFIRHLGLVFFSVALIGCSNFEDLRRGSFEPDYAVKAPTVMLVSKPENGRFIKYPIAKDQPLMLLKKGLAYSVYQVSGGKIGEIPNEDVRLKRQGEKFEVVYTKVRQRTSIQDESMGDKDIVVVPMRKGESILLDPPIETFPIFDNNLESVEPELPE
jgi:hypothetical protein